MYAVQDIVKYVYINFDAAIFFYFNGTDFHFYLRQVSFINYLSSVNVDYFFCGEL